MEKCGFLRYVYGNCPFGAISDKSQIFQLAHALKEGKQIIAEVAPSFIGQFGADVTPRKLKAALQEWALKKCMRWLSEQISAQLLKPNIMREKVSTGELPFLLTSCCPSWIMMAKHFFPDMKGNISQELTPMVATARTIKKQYPDAKVVFIGPCASKKLEASRTDVRSDVDFVITFEELAECLRRKGIDPSQCEGDSSFHNATAAGRGYAVAGGVSSAIEACLHEYYPEVEVYIEHAEGLDECKKILMQAKAGKLKGCMIEGMGCPGGCMAGAGTIAPLNKQRRN